MAENLDYGPVGTGNDTNFCFAHDRYFSGPKTKMRPAMTLRRRPIILLLKISIKISKDDIGFDPIKKMPWSHLKEAQKRQECRCGACAASFTCSNSSRAALIITAAAG